MAMVIGRTSRRGWLPLLLLGPPRAVGIAASSLALLLLPMLLASCGQATARPPSDPTPTPPPTRSTITTSPQLIWHPVSSSFSGQPTIDPGDGEVVYRCVAPGPNETVAHTFITRDAEATWSQAGDLPVGANPVPPSDSSKGFAFQCNMIVDATQPSQVVAETVWVSVGGNAAPSRFTSYATTDFGVHWVQLPAADALVTQLASYEDRIVALRFGDDPQMTAALWVSSDQFAAWQLVGSALPDAIESFWLNPSTGALLVHIRGQSIGSDQFYASTDEGKTWDQLSLPQLGPDGGEWAVEAPQGNRPWQICGLADPNLGDQADNLSCTTNGGQTWQARHALTQTQDTVPRKVFVVPTTIFALADDGAALVQTFQVRPNHIYRLLPGATDWQDLGPLPSPDVNDLFYAPTSSGGILWDATQQGVEVAIYPPSSSGGSS